MPLVLIVALIFINGCSSTEAGTPVPAGVDSATTSSNEPTTTPSLLVPPVLEPKDARNIATCDALTDGQIDQIGLDPECRHEIKAVMPFSTGCGWAKPFAWQFSIAFDTTRRGLTDTYLRRDSYRYFEPRTIGGYPAAKAQDSSDPRDCTVFVGIADTQQLFIGVSNNEATDKAPCDRVDEIVRLIIGNLPPLR